MLRRPAALNLAFVCLVAFVAGCTDNPLPEASQAEAGALPDVPTSTGLAASLVRYVGPEHIMTEYWHNGTYSVTDSAWPLGGPINMLLQDRRAERVFDITGDLPRGLPVMVMLEVDATVRGQDWPQGGDVDLGVRANDLDFVAAEWDAPYGGHTEGHVVVQAVSGDPIQIVLFYDEVDASAEISYTLHILLMGSADMLPPGAVAGLKLSPGDLLVLEPAGPAAEVSIYDPADNYVDRYDVADLTEIRIPSDVPDGEFILAAKQGGGGVRVSAVRNHTDPLRAIGFEWIAGVEKPVTGPSVKWEEDVDRPIIGTGLWIHATDQPYRCPAVDGLVTGPGDDELLRIQFDDPACFGGGPVGFGLWRQTQNGRSEVREGTYTMDVSARDSVNLVAQEWYLHYLR